MISGIGNTVSYIVSHKLLLILIVIAFVLTLLPVIFDGQYGCVKNQCGFIIGTNYRDGVWFQSVAASAFKTIPFRMPIFSGNPLQGYHYLPNLITYLLTFLGIPISISYYKIFPVLYMVTLTLLAIVLARKIKDNPAFVFFFLFFVFFGIPLSLITSLYHFGYIKTQLLINTFQSTRIFESMHLAFSLVILLATLLLMNKKKIHLKEKAFVGILIFFNFGIKFYIASIMLFMILFNELLVLMKQKNIKDYLVSNTIYSVSAIISVLIFYNPFGISQGGAIFTFAPFATVHHLIENENLFYLPNMVLARYFLYEHGWSPRLLAIEIFSSFLFVIFYFGTRIIGFIYVLKQIITRKITRMEIVLSAAVLLGIILSIMFVQKGDWFNPIQFAVGSSFFMNIFAARFMYGLWTKHGKSAIVIGTVVFILTFVPNMINIGYLSNPARYVIRREEMEALDYLKKKPDGAVFAPIVDPDLAYVSAFTGKQTYINFTNVLENTGIPFQQRLDLVNNPRNLDIDSLEVRYLYIPKTYKDHEVLITKSRSSKKYKEIFRNKTVEIFEKQDR